MKSLNLAFAHLIEVAPNITAESGITPDAIASISEPIDKGAIKLLLPYANSYIEYPPLEVEYLIRTLNEHLLTCLDIRQRAQELEIRAFEEASEQILQRRLLGISEEQASIAAKFEPMLLGNTIGAKFVGDAVIGTPPVPPTYWEQLLKSHEKQMREKKADADARLGRINEEGSGSNYVARFAFLKRLFERDLIEAFARAKAAAIGLKHVYGVDKAVPEVVDIGYLEKLVLWAREVSAELERKMFGTRECTVAFALHDDDNGESVPRIMTKEAFKASRATGTFSFTIPQSFFNRPTLRLKRPRLRGLDLHVWVNDTTNVMQFWRAYVKAPEQVVVLGGGAPNWKYQPIVFVPMCTYPGHVAEATDVPNQLEVNNAIPAGEWTINIEPKSIFGTATNADDRIVNLILRMRIAYDRE